MMPGTSFGGGNAPPNQNVSPFPQPPDYALNYTTDNIKNQRTLKPPPIPKKFSVFGEEIDLEVVSISCKEFDFAQQTSVQKIICGS